MEYNNSRRHSSTAATLHHERDRDTSETQSTRRMSYAAPSHYHKVKVSGGSSQTTWCSSSDKPPAFIVNRPNSWKPQPIISNSNFQHKCLEKSKDSQGHKQSMETRRKKETFNSTNRDESESQVIPEWKRKLIARNTNAKSAHP